MLDRLPAWLRHFVIILGSTLIGVVAPLAAANQDNISLWVVHTFRLPVWTLALIASAVGSLILRFTTATRQYGVGSTTPPMVPVIADPPVDLAPGGVVSAPSMAATGDHGPEMVVPLTPPGAFGAADPTPPTP